MPQPIMLPDSAMFKIIEPLRMLRPTVLVLAAVVAGCTSMAPGYQRPALPVPPAYPDDALLDQAAGTQRAAELGWREHFADPRLVQMIEQALTNNRDLRTAVLRVQEARASHGIQRAERLPVIGANGSANRARLPASVGTTGQAVTASQYQVMLGTNAWEIDFWGRVKSLQDAALETYLASDASRRALTVSLVAQVADGYLTLRELDERLVLAHRSMASQAESLRIFTRRVEVGATSRFDLTQVRSLAAQARALGAQLAQQRAAQAHALAQLIGGPVDLAPAVTPLEDKAVMPALAIGLPSDLLVDRPDILAAEHRLRAANANIGAARAAFFPRIALTANAGVIGLQLGGLFDADSRAWTFAPSISLPIFDGGARRGSLDLAEVRRDIAVADYEKTVQLAFRDVADALSDRQWLAEQVSIGQEALDAQTERARLAKLRYDNGATAFLDVLDAQRDLLEAEQSLVQIRRTLLSSRVALYAALGGGARHADTATTALESDRTSP